MHSLHNKIRGRSSSSACAVRMLDQPCLMSTDTPVPVLPSVLSHQASVLQVAIMGLIIISTILAASAPI